MPVSFAKTRSPLGEILLAATQNALIGAWFTGQKHFPPISPERLRQAPLIAMPGIDAHTSECAPVRFSDKQGIPRLPAKPLTSDPIPSPWLEAAAGQLGEFFCSTLRQFSLPLEPVGTPFQHLVWQALLAIPYGRICNYGGIAAAINRPEAARAVGTAVGRNPLSIFIPCHRVVGKNGALTGYAGGLDKKTFLLHLEKEATGEM